MPGSELVAVDQRGTGQSEALQCPEVSELLNGGFASYLGECGIALGPTRAFYTSQESVEDLDSLREALGGTPLSLFAVSYGGRVAAMYAREHPQGVARMVLDSPMPLTGPDPLLRRRSPPTPSGGASSSPRRHQSAQAEEQPERTDDERSEAEAFRRAPT
jgi:pimeloyl-ACP methyl ester carboxylesterase